MAVDFTLSGEGREQVLTFESHVGEFAEVGPEHPIKVMRDPVTDEPSPYVMMRSGLEALIDRKSFYRLVEIGTHHEGWFGLWSGGAFFKVITSEEMEE